MGQRFSRWFGGRNGPDRLARDSFLAALVIVIITFFTHSPFLYLVALGLLFYGYFRLMSRNIAKRQYENEKFVRFLDHTGDFFRNAGWKTRAFFTELWRKVRYGPKNFWMKHMSGRTGKGSSAGEGAVIFVCPSCGQKVRVPRGKGRIEITCPKCRHTFVRQS